MYCFIKIKDDRIEKTISLESPKGIEIADSVKNVAKILEAHRRVIYVHDALDDFDKWSREAKNGGAMILRNLHTAERLCRGFLFEFKTYLDHMQTTLSHRYGKKSQALQQFLDGTHDAYDNSPEYAFTYQLRNCSQHCENVVHTAMDMKDRNGVTPMSVSEKLLAEFGGWKANDKEFLKQTEKVDLLAVFKKTYDALGYVHTPVIQYMLDHDGVAADVMYLRKWANCLEKNHHVSKDEIWYWHFAHMIHSDGREVTEEEYQQNHPDREYQVMVLDWGTLYELSDALKTRI